MDNAPIKCSISNSMESRKEKLLPTIPLKGLSTGNVNNRFDDDTILQEKTLKRKNFKKLSLQTAVPDGSFLPNRQVGNIGSVNNTSAVKVRPAPLAGLRDSTDTLKYNRNNSSLKEEGFDSPQDVLHHFSALEISRMGSRSSAVRKRQTVISSISPTKSSSDSSPMDDKKLLNTVYSSSPLATTSSLVINNKDLFHLKNLGSGNSGAVSKVLHIPSEKIMAKKVIHIDSKSIIQTQIIRELTILHECQSPFIIDFYGAFIDTNHTIVLCMEYCNCGSLDKILALCEPKMFPLYVLKKMTYSVLSGLTYLYQTYKIIHRDIKPSNVLMTHKGQFKVCDFGVSRELSNSIALADTFVGTSTYMSPERIQGLKYGVKSDVWSIGIMLIELATGNFVWNDNSDGSNVQGPEGILDLLQRIVNESPPTLSNRIDPISKSFYDSDLCSFIDSCLIKDDKQRKSPAELLRESAFLKGVSDGLYDQQTKFWAKSIRKLHKSKNNDASVDDLKIN